MSLNPVTRPLHQFHLNIFLNQQVAKRVSSPERAVVINVKHLAAGRLETAYRSDAFRRIEQLHLAAVIAGNA